MLESTQISEQIKFYFADCDINGIQRDILKLSERTKHA